MNEILFARKLTRRRQMFKGKFLTGSAQIFLYACFSSRLSPRLNIYRRIIKFVQMIVIMNRVQG